MFMALFLSFAGSRYLLLFILSSYFHFVKLSKSMVFLCTFISYSRATFFIVQNLCDAKFSIKIYKRHSGSCAYQGKSVLSPSETGYPVTEGC